MIARGPASAGRKWEHLGTGSHDYSLSYIVSFERMQGKHLLANVVTKIKPSLFLATSFSNLVFQSVFKITKKKAAQVWSCSPGRVWKLKRNHSPGPNQFHACFLMMAPGWNTVRLWDYFQEWYWGSPLTEMLYLEVATAKVFLYRNRE